MTKYATNLSGSRFERHSISPQPAAAGLHVIAICGFNLAILVGVFMAVSRPLLGPRRSVYIALIGIVIYTLLVGAGASVVRAAIMSGLALIGQRLGRRAWRLNTLAAATDEEYTIRLGRACVRLIEAIDVGIEKERGQEDRTVLKGARLPIWPTQISTARCPSRLIESVAIGIFMSLVALWLTV